MKIEQTTRKTVLFWAIEDGEVFVNPHNNHPAMKIKGIIEDGEGAVWTAVDLETGVPLSLDEDEAVVSLDAKLIIP